MISKHKVRKMEAVICEASNFEEPSAVVPHAGIREG